MLPEILHCKKEEIDFLKKKISVDQLISEPYFHRHTISLKKRLQQSIQPGIIAEFKRRSPSVGWLFEEASVELVTNEYVSAGVMALSVLTETHYFGAQEDDLAISRKHFMTPILRKDFILDSYQIYETRAMGADVILLIAAALLPEQAGEFSALAQSMGLEVLLEIHSPSEIEPYLKYCTPDLIGVNSRDLNSLTIDLQTFYDIVPFLPQEIIRIAESGIEDPGVISGLNACGYRGYLIGSSFMRTKQPGHACKAFIQQISSNKKPFSTREIQ
jgi:indole-3-glycerol phosphate synthase